MASQRISSLTGSNAKAPYWVIRLFEILPGFTTWSIIILPIVLSIYVPLSVAVFIIAFDLLWLLKSFRMSASLLIGHRNLRIAGEIDWEARLMRLEQSSQDLIQDYTLSLAKRRDAIGSLWFLKKNGRREHEQLHQADLELAQLQEYIDRDSGIKPADVLHVVILATYNESLETLRPSIQALANVKYDLSKIWFVIAYEERGGEADEKRVKLLQKEFKGRFGAFHIFKHPADIVGEVKGKGPNISYAGKQILEVIKKQNIGINNVMVTTLDADHRPDPSYFNHLTYA
nr:hypothetical protein [Candidatus Saccharibacteria bacterium]